MKAIEITRPIDAEVSRLFEPQARAATTVHDDESSMRELSCKSVVQIDVKSDPVVACKGDCNQWWPKRGWRPRLKWSAFKSSTAAEVVGFCTFKRERTWWALRTAERLAITKSRLAIDWPCRAVSRHAR